MLNIIPWPTGKPTFRFKRAKGLRRIWPRLVSSYSSCAFTNLSDRVIALAGLEEQVRDAAKDVYLAGPWKRRSIKQLCWMAEKQSVRVSAFFAPSWTWLSVTGPVAYDEAYDGLGKRPFFALMS
jgi:hypothetical protein